VGNQTSIIFNPVLWLILALTLGLMPYTPEPHLCEKLKWIFSDAQGMQPSDWFDVLLHGTPWVFLIVSIIRKLFKT
jgi:hypothetical protein